MNPNIYNLGKNIYNLGKNYQTWAKTWAKKINNIRTEYRRLKLYSPLWLKVYSHAPLDYIIKIINQISELKKDNKPNSRS